MDSAEYVQCWCGKCTQLRRTIVLGEVEGSVPHHTSIRALADSAAAGCPVCRIFRQQFVHRPRYFDYPSYRSMLSDGNSSQFFVHVHRPTVNPPFLSLQVGTGRRKLHLSLQGNMFGESEGFETLPVGSYRQPLFDPRKSVKQLVTDVLTPWIELSNETTESASPSFAGVSNITATPTRLIQVTEGKQDMLRLYVPSEEENLVNKYLALSYCWGSGNAAACTTMQNYTERLHGIDCAALPQTIQDAVFLTRALGVRYLWVDAICIIQQHDEDWTREAPRMGGYYWNACLTIAAASANDSFKRFLHEREAYRFQLEEVLVLRAADKSKSMRTYDNLPTTAKEDNNDWYLRPMVPKFEFQVARSPLYTRGWTLQERLLSRRIVHFTEEEVLWETFSGVRCRESSSVVVQPENFSIKPWTSESNSRALSIHNLVHSADNSFLQSWTDLIATYGKMSFSFEKDRLVAIQGIIDRLLLKHAGYSAGVFHKIAIQQLLWTKAPEASDSRITKNPIYPSWSWASMSATEISFDHDMVIESTEMAKLDEIEKFSILGREGERQIACRLTVRGVLRGLKLSRRAGMIYGSTIPDHAGDFSLRGVQRSSGAPYLSSKHLLHLNYDTSSTTHSSSNRVFCLGSGHKEAKIQSQARDVYGLLLEPTSKSGEYRRLGVFRDCCIIGVGLFGRNLQAQVFGSFEI